jgi:hypothetical protein
MQSAEQHSTLRVKKAVNNLITALHEQSMDDSTFISELNNLIEIINESEYNFNNIHRLKPKHVSNARNCIITHLDNNELLRLNSVYKTIDINISNLTLTQLRIRYIIQRNSLNELNRIKQKYYLQYKQSSYLLQQSEEELFRTQLEIITNDIKQSYTNFKLFNMYL